MLVQNAGGIAGDCSIGRNIFGDHSPGAHRCLLANREAAKNYRAAADAGPALDDGGHRFPISLCLQIPSLVCGSRKLVIDENDAVPDEDFIFNRDGFADKTVTRYFAVTPYPRVLLNLDESSDFGSVTNFAAVEIYEVINNDIAPEFYIRRDDTELTRHELVRRTQRAYADAA